MSHFYWSGAKNASDTGCQCSLSKTCQGNVFMNHICNCDTGGVGMIDQGVLSDKNSLPVKALRYGAFTAISSIKYMLGPFICTGKNQIYPSEKSDRERERIQDALKSIEKEIEDDKKKTEEKFQILENYALNLTLELQKTTEKYINEVYKEVDNNIQALATNFLNSTEGVQKVAFRVKTVADSGNSGNEYINRIPGKFPFK